MKQSESSTVHDLKNRGSGKLNSAVLPTVIALMCAAAMTAACAETASPADAPADSSRESITAAAAASDTGRESDAENGSLLSGKELSGTGLTADAGAASSADASENSASSKNADTSESSVSGPVMLDYIDAWQEWHTMEVDPSVTANSYAPDGFSEKDGRKYYTDSSEYDAAGDEKKPVMECIQGIDVSEFQGEIDWETVAESGIEFAFIRAGFRGYGEEGKLVEDTAAVRNLQEAKAAGLKVGVYVFSQAVNEEEAREEAALAIRVLEKADVEADLPLIYDPEIIKHDDGRANDITREQVALNTAAFSDEVERLSGYETDIYSNLPWEDHYFDADTMNRYRIWYADYEKIPQTPYHFTWWQYTQEGSVPGIEGLVDIDMWIRPAN